MLRTLLLLTACVALLAPNAHSQGAVDFRDALRMTFPATVSIEADEQGQRRQRQAIAPNGLPGFGGFVAGLGDLNLDANRPVAQAGFAISADMVIAQIGPGIQEAVVRTFDETEHRGRVVARDHVTGLSVLKVDDVQLVSLVVGDGTPEAGLPVVTTWLANGVGTSKSGMIACPPNSSQPALGFTQQIDSGKQLNTSGSPVVDSEGVLVGITVASDDGMIVCIPAEQLTRLIDLALGDEPKDLSRGMVGIQFDSNAGPIVSAISDNSPAKDAGLAAGDKITRINDHSINSFQDVIAAVAMARSGDSLEVTFDRGDETLNRTIELKEHPQQGAKLSALPGNQPADQAGQRNPGRMGQVIRKAWKVEDGQLVPMDVDKDGEVDIVIPRKIEDMFRGMQGGNIALPDQFKLPGRWEGFQIERSDTEESLKEFEADRDQQLKKIQELTDKIRELESK